MEMHPKVGSLWRYTGRNPEIRYATRSQTFQNPILEVLPADSPHSVELKWGSTGQDRIRYPMHRFSKYFVPYEGLAKDLLTPLQVMITLALINNVSKEDIHDLLVKIKI